MVTRRLLIRIVTEIKTIMVERGLSSRQLAELCNEKGYDKVTRSKILRAFYVENKKQFFLNNTDDTIEGVLATLGFTGDDVLHRILEDDKEDTNPFKNSGLSEEVIEFIQNKEAEPYLRLAYAQYQNKKVQAELERLQKEINQNN